MKDLNKSQRDFLETLTVGKTVDIATSDYSIDPIQSTGWNPIAKHTAAGVRALIKKGYLNGLVFWRGATVTRVK